MNISPKHFLLGMAVGFAIIFTTLGIGEIKQEDPVTVMGMQDENTSTPALTPTPTTTPTPIPTATLTPTPIPTSVPTATPTVIPTAAPYNAAELVMKYAAEYGIEDDILFTIGQCESGFNATSVNGPYGGIYQFHFSTWASIRNSMGLDPNPELRFNPEESIRTAAFKISRDGAGAWPACSSIQ